MLFLGEFGADEGLDCGGVGGGGEETVADFLDVAEHVVFDGGEGH